MYLANIHDNIMKAPIIQAAAAAADEQAKVETEERQAERLERALAAEEQVREVHQTENEGVRTDREQNAEELDEDRQRRRPPRRYNPFQREGDTEPSDDDDGHPPLSGDHHLDVTA